MMYTTGRATMSKKDDGWKDYADATPVLLNFDTEKGMPAIKQIVIKEVQYRKTINEQMGMVKIEHVIEIRHGKKSVRFVHSHGMVALNSPQAKRIKHLSMKVPSFARRVPRDIISKFRRPCVTCS